MPKSKKAKRSRFSRLNRQHLLLALLVVSFLAISVLAYSQVWGNNDPVASDADLTAGEDGDYVNLDPPTDEEKKSTEEHKKNLGEYDNPPDSGATVVPVITSANQNEVRGYVTGVFEDGGTCTATATKGSQTKTATSKGFTDVNKTACAQMKWSSPLSDGGWSITLTYKSSNASGKSEAVMVN